MGLILQASHLLSMEWEWGQILKEKSKKKIDLSLSMYSLH